MVINVHVADNGPGAVSNDSDEIWRPVRFSTRNESSANEHDRSIDESFRTLRSLLNKLSSVNFCKVVDKFKSLILDNPVILEEAAALLVEKAVTEPLFSKWYVDLLCSISDGLAIDEIEKSIPYRIRMLFVEKLVLVFDDLRSHESNIQNRDFDNVIEETETQELLKETEFKFQRKFVGVGRVIAESFILGILSFGYLSRCIEILLSSYREMSLKCLCELLTTVGKFFEFHLDDAEINEYFRTISKISENSELSTRSRLMLLNLVEYKDNSWTSRTVLRNLQFVGQLLNALSELYAKKDDSISVTSSESDFIIGEKEAQCINEVFNKFTQYPRNLAAVFSSFNELAVQEKTKLVRLFIMCVCKGDIYSEDCGKLFALLIKGENLSIPDIILGIKSVIYGYRKNLIFADQQIWIRLKEIFQPLFADGVFSLSDLENDSDIQKAKKIEVQKEKQSKKKSKSEFQETKLSWRRGLPILKGPRGGPKKLSDTESKTTESTETDSKKDENESR